MDAIILAGGKGTRMRPLTNTTPKPLLTVQGRPILEWTLRALPAQVDHVIVVVKYLQEQIADYMATQTLYPQYTLVEQLPEPLGTGHAVQCCAPHIRSDQFLVILGDDLHGSAGLARLAAVEYGTLTIEREDMARWGVVVTDENGYVTRLHEKPAEGTYPIPVQVSIGGHKFDKSIFEYDLPLSERGEYEATDYLTWLASRRRVLPVPADFWFPIGTPEQLEAAQTVDLSPVAVVNEQ